VVLTFRWVKSKTANHFITSKAEYTMKRLITMLLTIYKNTRRLIDLSNTVKRAIELYQLKSDTKKKKGEHIFSSRNNLKKLKMPKSKMG
jgi:hypothetical protein